MPARAYDVDLAQGPTTTFDIALEHTPALNSLADCTLNGKRPDENHLGFGWIAIALQGVVTPRPMTHDLMKELIGANGKELNEVRITPVYGPDGTLVGIGLSWAVNPVLALVPIFADLPSARTAAASS